MKSIQNRRSTVAAAAFVLAATMALPAPARADRCDDLAAQLKGQIDGLKVGITAAKIIYLSHPQAKEMSLGCESRDRDFSNELFVKFDGSKPTPAFLELVADAAALIFTIPKPDVLNGATRCIKRMGILHGNDVAMRYRRLDMNCTRTKTEATIAISRGKDE